jgi:hypothetical protein
VGEETRFSDDGGVKAMTARFVTGCLLAVAPPSGAPAVLAAAPPGGQPFVDASILLEPNARVSLADIDGRGRLAQAGRLGGIIYSFLSTGSGQFRGQNDLLRWDISCNVDIIDDSRSCLVSKGDIYVHVVDRGALRSAVFIGHDVYPGSEVTIRLDSGVAISAAERGWNGEAADHLIERMYVASVAATRFRPWPSGLTDRITELAGFKEAHRFAVWAAHQQPASKFPGIGAQPQPITMTSSLGTVLEVVAGDLVRVDLGDRVELVQLACLAGRPRGLSVGEVWMLGRRVTLDADPEQPDRAPSGALIRYVSAGGVDVGEELLKERAADLVDGPCSRRSRYLELAPTVEGGGVVN